MAGHKRSWLLPLLEAACPSVSPDLLLAVRGRDVLLLRIRAACVILSAPAGDRRLHFACGPPSQTFFIVTLARNRVNNRDWE